MPKPQLQHRHFCFIADVIASLGSTTSALPPGIMTGPNMNDDAYTRDYIARAFGAALKGTNPAFDWDRFLDAARGKPSGRDKVRG